VCPHCQSVCWPRGIKKEIESGLHLRVQTRETLVEKFQFGLQLG
jgi:hypothetical protein